MIQFWYDPAVTEAVPLLQLIKDLRDDEMAHHDTALEHDAESVSLHRAHATNKVM